MISGAGDRLEFARRCPSVARTIAIAIVGGQEASSESLARAEAVARLFAEAGRSEVDPGPQS